MFKAKAQVVWTFQVVLRWWRRLEYGNVTNYGTTIFYIIFTYKNSYIHIYIWIYICDILKFNFKLLFQIKCSLYHLKPNLKKFIFHAMYLSFRLIRSKKTLNNKKLRWGRKRLEKTINLGKSKKWFKTAINRCQRFLILDYRSRISIVSYLAPSAKTIWCLILLKTNSCWKFNDSDKH